MAEQGLKQQTRKGLYWKFIDQFSNQGVQFIIGIVMARLLSPSDYGITALPAVFLSIAGVFIEAGFVSALIRKTEVTDSDLTTSFLYSLIVGGLCYILLFIASPWIAAFYDVPVLTPLIRVTALRFLYGTIGTPQQVILKRKLDFKTPAIISVIARVLSGALGIYLAYSGHGVWALVLASLFSDIVTIALTISVVRWFPKGGWSKDSFRYLWGFGNKMMASRLLDTVYGNITPIIVGKFFSPSDLGVYDRANRYAGMPALQIHGILREVSFPVLSKIKDDSKRLISAYSTMIKVSTFIIFPIMMLFSALSEPLIITILTEKWEACIILMQLLCFSKMWFPVHALNLNILTVSGRSDLFLRLEIIKKVVGLVVMCCALPFGLVAFCAAQIASAVIMVFINTWYTGKLYGYGFEEQIKDILPTLILSLVVFGCVTLLSSLLSNMYLKLILGGLLGVAIFGGGALLFKFEEIKELKFLLKR